MCAMLGRCLLLHTLVKSTLPEEEQPSTGICERCSIAQRDDFTWQQSNGLPASWARWTQAGIRAFAMGPGKAARRCACAV
jgi:hypothetical protein